MRAMALLLAIAAAACLAGAGWLGAKTLHFFRGAGYAPQSAHMPGYSAGNIEADGTGIFVPVLLLLALGLFLARFSFNLWQGERKRRKRADAGARQPPPTDKKQAPGQ